MAKATTEEQGMSAEERDGALRQAYQAATKRLRDEHRDEFNGFYSQEAEARGVTWTPRKTAEEKAAEDLQRLLQQFPHLATQVLPTSETEREQPV